MKINEKRKFTFELTEQEARDLKFEMREIRIKLGAERQFLEDCPIFNKIQGYLEPRV